MRTRIVVAGILLLFAFGCKPSPPVRAGPTEKVGVITSLTGSEQAFGTQHERGYTLALEELNASGGVLGKPLEIIKYDDQSKADVAVQGVSKLVDQDKVPVVIGAYASQSTLALVPAVVKRQVPLLIPTATADNVLASKSPWVFRVCSGADDLAHATADFLKATGLPKSMAIVYENTNFGQANAGAMRTWAKTFGIPVVADEAYGAGSPSYTAMLQNVKQKAPEAIYFASYLLDATQLMKQARQVNLNPRVYTSAGTGFALPSFLSGAGKDAEYTLSGQQWMRESKWPGSKQFADTVKARWGEYPSYHAVQAYVSLKIVADAVKRAGKWEPAAIRDAIASTEMMSIFGPIKFVNQQNQHPVLITQVQKGAFQIVAPADQATAQVILPTPPWSARP
ncbi:MAG: ABC transporter substrate-binding protein [Myxococcaceae bacterium]